MMARRQRPAAEAHNRQEHVPEPGSGRPRRLRAAQREVAGLGQFDPALMRTRDPSLIVRKLRDQAERSAHPGLRSAMLLLGYYVARAAPPTEEVARLRHEMFKAYGVAPPTPAEASPRKRR